MNDNRLSILTRAQELVLKCGIRPYLIGCKFLAEAVVLRARDSISYMDIYRRVAADNHIGYKSVMRDINYAISLTYDLHERLSDLMGIDISRNDIHSGLVIAYLAFKLRTVLEQNGELDLLFDSDFSATVG